MSVSPRFQPISSNTSFWFPPPETPIHMPVQLNAAPASTAQPMAAIPVNQLGALMSAGLLPLNGVSPAAAPKANALKQAFQQNKAVIYALNIRTFGAVDRNGDGKISVQLGENGTFLSSIAQLDRLKAMGVNAVHLLPIHPIGQEARLGEAGSLYAPADYHQLNNEFDVPGNATTVEQEARQFIEAAHQRGIAVMVDVPSCASIDLVKTHPELIARDEEGNLKTPGNWVDIRMFENNEALKQYFQGYFDLMVNRLGVDGFRVDVARARSTDFWKHFISQYPDKAWLAETYTEEDSSPMLHVPRDIPEELLRQFDAIYGQFHIFHSMKNAPEYMQYLTDTGAMMSRAQTQGDGQPKSVIGSFLTHDDPSLMTRGGPIMCMLASGLMATQPYTNPYILDGFTSGYEGPFDIFNWRLSPTQLGKHPEIGQFLSKMLALRQQYDPVFTYNAGFVPLGVSGEDSDQVIAFLRMPPPEHAGRIPPFLVIANKDVNARHQATISLPKPLGGLGGIVDSATSKNNMPEDVLKNLAPDYGDPSTLSLAHDGEQTRVNVDLGPGRFHLFALA